nr:DUF2637 domain-containing protein [Prescottella equi]ARX59560.1 putative bacteriophage excisionase [Prescottella equi]
MPRKGPRSDSHQPTRNAKAANPDQKQSPAFWAALTLTSMICLASFILSFVALADLLHMTGQPRELSYLFPVIIDGTILQATISILWLAGNDDRGKERRFFWTVLAVAAGVSIAGNALHAWVSHAPDFDPLLAAAISTIPPISLLAASHGLTILARTPKRAPAGEGSSGTSSPLTTISDESVRDAPEAELVVAGMDPKPQRLATPAVMADAQDQAAAPRIEKASASEGHGVETVGMEDEAGFFASRPDAHPLPQEIPTVTSTTPPRDPVAVDLSTATTDQLRDYALRRKALGIKPKEIAVEVNRNISTVYRWIDDAAKSAGDPQLVR